MSLRIIGPRPYFWQWDTGQKLEVTDTECGEVHYCNGTGECALVVPIKTAAEGTRYAEVPNILLQAAKSINAYLYRRNPDGAETVTLYRFPVMARNRPEEYVYTETEVLNYNSLVARIDQIERNGVSDAQIAAAVEAYLAENPAGVNFEVDHTLTLENGILSVNTADAAEPDNTQPITSAAVHTSLGNIEVLLATI